jgi:putative ABC transport system permease protein
MDLGYNTDHVYYANIRDTSIMKKLPVLKQEFLKIPEVEYVSSSENIMGQGILMDVMLIESDEDMQEQLLGFYFIDHDYIDLMDLELIQGRDFDIRSTTDVDEAILINEKAVEEFGWSSDPLGKKILRRNPVKNYQVIGIVRDFNFNTLHNAIEPMAFILNDAPNSFMYLKISGHDPSNTLKKAEKIWDKADPSHPFIYHSLSGSMRDLYVAERKLLSIIGFFAFLSIFIAVLGLFSLSSFVTEQYAKEVGIRKVLGSSVSNIFLMLSKKFMILVIVANLLAWPVSWFIMNKWLENFVYHTSIQWWVFVMAGLISFLVALITISYQTYRSARINPVEVLKYE